MFPGSFSCTCVQKKEKVENADQSFEKRGIPRTPNESLDSVFYLLPSPGEILEHIQTASVKYNSEIINPAGNSDKYLGSRAQSLNLGVFIADMAYSALCEKSPETVKFLETIRTLSNELGISSSIFESLIERAKANAGNMDSLLNISNEAFSGMLEFLETGGKENILALVSTGAYVESLYLAVQSVSQYSEKDPVIMLIAEMKYPLDNLYERAKSGSEDENIKSIMVYLDQITAIFSELDSKSTQVVISENQKGIISLLGGEKVNINEKNFTSLKTRVVEIRNTIVSF